jgi:putative membrane protein
MELIQSLPEVIVVLNVCATVLLTLGWRAIRSGQRERHRALMLANLGVAVLFLIVYLTMITTVGHERFSGEGWLRTAFMTILISHTILAVSLVGFVPRTVYLAWKQRFQEHRRLARVTMPIWLYVTVTGIVIYLMLHHLPLCVSAPM